MTDAETAATAPVEPTLDEVPDPDQLVRTAEEEAEEAQALALSLEQRWNHGDEDVTPEQIDKQRSLAKWAVLAVQRATIRARRIKTDRRYVAAEQLKAEIDAHVDDVGPALAKALEAVIAAERKFLAIADARDQQLYAWRDRAIELGIPEATNQPVPPAEDARLAVGNSAGLVLQAGPRKIEAVHGGVLLQRFRDSKSDPSLVDWLRNMTSVTELPGEELHFYRRHDGQIFWVQPGLPLEQTFKDSGMKQVAREEALGL